MLPAVGDQHRAGSAAVASRQETPPRGNDAASDVTAITGQPELTITKTHVGNFTVGVNGSYTLTVTKTAVLRRRAR